MNSIQKIIKYCAMAFAGFLSVVIIGSIVAGLLSVLAGLTVGKDIFGDRERVNLSERYSKEQLAEQGIHGIMVDCNAEILVKQGEELSVEAVQVTKDCEIRPENGRICVTHRERDFLMNWFSWFDTVAEAKVVITVPEEFMLKELVIDSGSGRVSVSDLTGELLSISSGSGKVNVTNTVMEKTGLESGSGKVTVKDSVLGKLYLDSGSGAVMMERVVAREVELDSGSGAVSLNGELTGNCDFSTGSGAVSLILTGNEEEYCIEADCGSGAFRVNGRKREDGSYGTNVKGKLRIDSGSGSVDVEFTGQAAEERTSRKTEAF